MTVERHRPSLDARLAGFEAGALLGQRAPEVRLPSAAAPPMSPTASVPAEVHSSAHQVRYEGSLIGEYEVRIYRGCSGPVIILQEGSSSPLPLEYLSEYAVTRFVESLPHGKARFFERHLAGAGEQWVEVSFQHGAFRRDSCTPAVVAVALAPAPPGAA
jgi:hypothetical protein